MFVTFSPSPFDFVSRIYVARIRKYPQLQSDVCDKEILREKRGRVRALKRGEPAVRDF
jgi:hypothetical protein